MRGGDARRHEGGLLQARGRRDLDPHTAQPHVALQVGRQPQPEQRHLHHGLLLHARECGAQHLAAQQREGEGAHGGAPARPGCRGGGRLAGGRRAAQLHRVMPPLAALGLRVALGLDGDHAVRHAHRARGRRAADGEAHLRRAATQLLDEARLRLAAARHGHAELVLEARARLGPDADAGRAEPAAREAHGIHLDPHTAAEASRLAEHGGLEAQLAHRHARRGRRAHLRVQRRHELGCAHLDLDLGAARARAAVPEQRHLLRRRGELLAAEQRPERHAARGEHARSARRAARQQLQLQLQRRGPVARAARRVMQQGEHAAEGAAALAERERACVAEVELGAVHHRARAAHRRQVERGGQQRDGDLHGLAAQLAQRIAAQPEAARAQVDAHRAEVGVVVCIDKLGRRPGPASLDPPGRARTVAVAKAVMRRGSGAAATHAVKLQRRLRPQHARRHRLELL